MVWGIIYICFHHKYPGYLRIWWEHEHPPALWPQEPSTVRKTASRIDLPVSCLPILLSLLLGRLTLDWTEQTKKPKSYNTTMRYACGKSSWGNRDRIGILGKVAPALSYRVSLSRCGSGKESGLLPKASYTLSWKIRKWNLDSGNVTLTAVWRAHKSKCTRQVWEEPGGGFLERPTER